MKKFIWLCCALWSAATMAGEKVYTGAGEDLYALFADGEFRYGECRVSLSEGGGAVHRNISILRLEKATDSNGETYDRVLDSYYVEVVPDTTEIRGTSRVLKDYYELEQRNDGTVSLKVKDYRNYYKGGDGPFSIIGGGGGRYAGYTEKTLTMVIDIDSRKVLKFENTMQQYTTRGISSVFNFLNYFLRKKPVVDCE